jgi:hypothetical protein
MTIEKMALELKKARRDNIRDLKDGAKSPKVFKKCQSLEIQANHAMRNGKGYCCCIVCLDCSNFGSWYC